MTVHGERPHCPDRAGHTGRGPLFMEGGREIHHHRGNILVNGERELHGGRGPLLVNGEQKIEGPMLENLTLSQSWNGCIWQLQQTSPEAYKSSPGQNGMLNTFPMSGKFREFVRRDSLLSKSRDSPPISLGSTDRPSSVDRLSNDRLSTDRLSSGDRLSNSSDRNRFATSYDDDSLTTASSNFDSSEQEEEYVTLDRSYGLSRSFRSHPVSHHSSMIDLKHNSLYSPKINNDEAALHGGSTRTLPHRKFRGPLRSVSVNETDLDSVDVDGKSIPWAKRSLKRIYENIGEALKQKQITPKSPSEDKISIQSGYVGIRNDFNSSESGSVNTEASTNSGKTSSTGKLRKRSKSLGELRLFGEQNENELDSETDNSDIDGDDFGFLSHSFVHSTPAMQKSKSPSAHHRILPKRWRSKPRNSTAGQCLWSPEGNCTWCNVSGRRVVLRPVSLLQLSEAERLALQKIVLQKLQSEDLGCPVVIPKEHRESGRRKKHLLSIKRSKSANISGFIHSLADREKDHQLSGLVFGIPLQKCIANDAEQRKRNGGALKERKGSDVILTRQTPRKSSSSSQGSLENITHNGTSFSESQKRNASSDSLSESESSRNNSSLIDALVLSNNRSDNLGQDYLPLYATGPPQVPHIVKVCFKHIETYGLRVLGIFRVGCSKKRTKQLRDEFDTGRDVKLNESHNPHEVGAVLKEYFRDLPEPLLTRDLYSPLIAARGLYQIEKQIDVTRMLISLLPVANRDTLWALLQFLYKVAEHSTDALDENGQTLPGNKMDSHNLATLFGPNILHKAKATEKEFTVESMERAEERKEVIDVVQSMIESHQLLFQIPASMHDEILRLLLETDPDTTEQILKRISSENGIDADPDTSSSLYDDSDASMPHSPVSESNLHMKDSSGQQSNPTLRCAKSAEILTPVARRKFFYSSPEEENERHRRKSDVNNPMERPKFHLVIENSPSPPEVNKTQQSSRTTRNKMSRDNSSPDLTSRPHSIHIERPHSELYCSPKTLSIPAPDYMRQISDSRSSSTLNNPSSRSESFNRSNSGGSRAASSSPRVTSSIQRPLNFNRGAPEVENEWQKNRWRQWDNVSEKPVEGYEQETLV